MSQRTLKTQIHIMGWLFISPILLGSIVFSFTPVVYSLMISFTEWNAVQPAKFIGLGNFKLILGGDPYFLQAVRNTIVFSLGSIFFSIFFGLMLALLANQKIMGQNFYRTAFFAPSVTSTIAIGIVFSFIYEPNMGLLNSVPHTIGIHGPDWLGSSRFALMSVIIVQVWGHAGYNMVIYLAGLQGIPKSYYESARIDGANRFHQFWYITLPMLSPTTFFLMITSFIGSFQVLNLVYGSSLIQWTQS